MEFWTHPVVGTTLALAILLLFAEAARRTLPLLQKIALPGSILAGTVGLLLGPTVAGVVPVDTGVLEAIVYHGLAVVFIAVSLESAPKGRPSTGGVSMGFAITTMFTGQMALGLALVAVLSVFLGALHPGWGMLVPMGFEEGPGQALSFGIAWEATGLTDGRQIGLIIAALGFAWSVVVGVPLVAWGRARGLFTATADGEAGEAAHDAGPLAAAGALEPLSLHLGVIGLCYALTYAVCSGLAAIPAIASDPGLVGAVWGVHFILGAVVALAVRVVLGRVAGDDFLHNGLLGRISGATVDFITCGALTAIAMGVLTGNLGVLLVVTGVGGLYTAIASLWLSRRAFRESPFEHAVLLFGMSTGTLPTGLALLRSVDPELRGPAPRSAVLGSALAIPGVAIPMMFISNAVASGWAKDPSWTLIGLGLCTAYLAVVVGGWWLSGRLDVRLKPLSLWPREAPHADT